MLINSPRWILIPARNEEQTIGDVIRAVRCVVDYPILVINSQSIDRTAEVASQAGARVVDAPEQGYWQALRTGYHYLLQQTNCQEVVQLDADGQHDPIHIPRFFDRLQQAEPLWVVGSRYRTGTPQESSLQLGQTVLKSWMKIGFAIRYQDMSSGFWGLNRATLEKFSTYTVPHDTADVAMRVFASRLDICMVEFPTAMNPRYKGVSMHQGLWHRCRHLWQVVHDVRSITTN